MDYICFKIPTIWANTICSLVLMTENSKISSLQEASVCWLPKKGKMTSSRPQKHGVNWSKQVLNSQDSKHQTVLLCMFMNHRIRSMFTGRTAYFIALCLMYWPKFTTKYFDQNCHNMTNLITAFVKQNSTISSKW